MRKVIFIFVLLSSLLFMGNEEYVIPGQSIRLRIIPSSNSSRDIVMKEKTTKEMMNIISDFDSTDIDSSRQEIISNINNVENKLTTLFKDNNYDETFNIKYGLNEFPEKVYRGVKYEEGYYESLVVEIGEAKGNNYWCVLYPPLCLIDENEGAGYKSKIVEIINKFF